MGFFDFDIMSGPFGSSGGMPGPGSASGGVPAMGGWGSIPGTEGGMGGSDSSGFSIPGMDGGGLPGMGGGSGSGGSVGSTGGLLGKLFGTKPVTPAYPVLNDATKTALQNNLGNFDTAMELSSRTNRANQSSLLEMLHRVIPNYEGIQSEIGQSFLDAMQGKLAKAERTEITNTRAARSFSQGVEGSGFHSAGELRDLGIGIRQNRLQAQDGFTKWASATRALAVPGVFDVSNMFIPPGAQFQANVGAFGRDMHAANIAAAPDPGVRGAFDSAMSLAGMVLSVYGGGAGYTGTYRPNNGGDAGGGSYGGSGSGGADWRNYFDYDQPSKLTIDDDEAYYA